MKRLLAAAGAALADDIDCDQSDGLNRSIQACSNIIAAGQESRENPAVAYSNRGNDYDKKDVYDTATADYDKAIQFQPDFAIAYDNRGKAYREKGETAKALVDHRTAGTNSDRRFRLAAEKRWHSPPFRHSDKGRT